MDSETRNLDLQTTNLEVLRNTIITDWTPVSKQYFKNVVDSMSEMVNKEKKEYKPEVEEYT